MTCLWVSFYPLIKWGPVQVLAVVTNYWDTVEKGPGWKWRRSAALQQQSLARWDCRLTSTFSPGTLHRKCGNQANCLFYEAAVWTAWHKLLSTKIIIKNQLFVGLGERHRLKILYKKLKKVMQYTWFSSWFKISFDGRYFHLLSLCWIWQFRCCQCMWQAI